MKKFFCLFLSIMMMSLSIPFSTIFATSQNSELYMKTEACPQEYYDYATQNASDFVFSVFMENYEVLYVGQPFSFCEENANIFYFPIICDGSLKYLLRVYEVNNKCSAVISEFLTTEIDELAHLTSVDTPMCLKIIDSKIVAIIGESQFVLYEYPIDICVNTNSDETLDCDETSEEYVINIKDNSNIELNPLKSRDVYHYINLNIKETQTTRPWCTAYCLATIIRTKTSHTDVTAKTCMRKVYGIFGFYNDKPFPWDSIDDVAQDYGLNPIVLWETVDNSVWISELNANRPMIMAMTSNYNGVVANHAVVLRGFTSDNRWSIWNPWYEMCELYNWDDPYVPMLHTTYQFYPYMFAYNFG